MRRKWILPITAAVLLFCSACAVLPKEEQLPEAPVLRVSEDEVYAQVAVSRGDLVLTEEIDCKYQPAVEEKLAFTLDDQVIQKIYVSEGDEVSKGDLVAELENTSLMQQIKAQQYVIDTMQLQADHLQERRDLYYSRCNVLTGAAAADPGRYAAALSSAEQTSWNLTLQLEDVQRALDIEQVGMQELQDKLALRQLYAGMDGTVRNVMNTSRKKLSTAGQSVCVISNLESTAFSSKTEKGAYHKGDRVEIFYDDQSHSAIVGEVRPEDDDQELVLLRLEQPDPTLGTGIRGKIVREKDRRENVLLLPAQSVWKMDNGNIVYYLDENGIKQSKVVEIGLEAEGKIEILSGLEEGEMVMQ